MLLNKYITMKSLYEGILSDIETSVSTMDDDIEKVQVFEWLEYNAIPVFLDRPRPFRKLADGRISTYEEWKDYVEINKDGSVNFKCGLDIRCSNTSKGDSDKVPFKIHCVNYVFKVGSPYLKTTENFPDIVDSLEFAQGIKIKIENWHVQVKQEYVRGESLLNSMIFANYNTPENFPCIYIRKGPVFGKNVVFECIRKDHGLYNRPIIYMPQLNKAMLKKIKFINIPYILLSNANVKLPSIEDLDSAKNNLKDVKLITSAECNIYVELYYSNITKTGVLIKQKDGKFKEVLRDEHCTSNDYKVGLSRIKMKYKDLL